MDNKQKQTVLAVVVVVLVIVVLAFFFLFMGGGGGQDTASAPQPPMSQMDDRDGGFAPPAPTGGPAPMGGPGMMGQPPAMPATPPPNQQATKPPFTPRKDPFAYLPEEQEALQADAFDPNRYFVLASPPTPPRVELPEPFEPQPRRRVSGIVIGTTVSAILEQEGENPQIVQPGDTVGEFRVAAITPEGVILRRSRGNPREVIVRYEPPAPGGGTGGGQTGGFAPGAPGGGPPAAPGAAGAGGVGGGRGGRGAAPGL